MARLGRGRREGARIRRNVSTPTPTPLVRNRVKQTPNGARRAWVVAKAWRRRHAHVLLRSPLPLFGQKPKQPIVSQADVRASRRVRFFQQRSARYSRAPSTPTPTPLVRKRLVQTPTGNDRAHVVARAWRRKRAHIVMRAPQPGPQQPKQPQPIISRAAVRAASRTRAFQQRTARLIHAVSVPTPTPLVRKRVVQTPNGNDRAQVVARAFRRRRAHILIRSNPTATAPTQTPRAPLVTHRARAARVRAAARTHVRILRSIVAPQRPVKVITAAPAARRAARVRFTQRHRARIIAPHVTAPVVVRQQQPRVTRQRASQRIRYTRARQPVILRGPLVVTGRRTVRTLVIVRNRRAANVRAYFLRHRAHYETSTLGSAAPPVVIYTGFYDHPSPADGFDGPSLAANGYDQPSPTSGYDEPSLATAGFDQPSPTSGGYDH